MGKTSVGRVGLVRLRFAGFLMEKTGRFPEYLFAKMGPVEGGGAQATGASGARLELSGLRRGLKENLLLVVTLSGVILGAILGKFFVIIDFLNQN